MCKNWNIRCSYIILPSADRFRNFAAAVFGICIKGEPSVVVYGIERQKPALSVVDGLRNS
ncbi:MAG: hypothetical protein IJ325_10155 [Clostridia bacterium]|nr:hypothetical protein [Clostridia bacterium]